MSKPQMVDLYYKVLKRPYLQWLLLKGETYNADLNYSVGAKLLYWTHKITAALVYILQPC